MEVDAAALRAPGVGRDGHVDWAVNGFEELPENGSGGVAEDRAGTAGEHSRHEAPVEAQSVMADGVDAAVDAVQAPRARSF